MKTKSKSNKSNKSKKEENKSPIALTNRHALLTELESEDVKINNNKYEKYAQNTDANNNKNKISRKKNNQKREW